MICYMTEAVLSRLGVIVVNWPCPLLCFLLLYSFHVVFLSCTKSTCVVISNSSSSSGSSIRRLIGIFENLLANSFSYLDECKR